MRAYRIGVIRGRRHRPRGRRARASRCSTPSGTDSPSELVEFDLGADRYLRTGDVLPDEELERLRDDGRDLPGRGRRPPREAGHPRARPAAEGAVRAGPVREPAPGRAVPRGGDARAQPRRGRRELRRGPRELRRALHGRRRVPPQGHAARGRGAGIDQHAARRGADRALRVRAGDAAATAAASSRWCTRRTC